MDIKIGDNFRLMVQETIDGYKSRLILLRKKNALPSEIEYVKRCITNFTAILEREGSAQVSVQLEE